MPDWAGPLLRAEIQRASRKPATKPSEARAATRLYEAMTDPFESEYVGEARAQTDSAGPVPRVDPLYDEELFDFYWVSQQELFAGGTFRGLLRLALRGMLPDVGTQPNRQGSVRACARGGAPPDTFQVAATFEASADAGLVDPQRLQAYLTPLIQDPAIGSNGERWMTYIPALLTESFCGRDYSGSRRRSTRGVSFFEWDATARDSSRNGRAGIAHRIPWHDTKPSSRGWRESCGAREDTTRRGPRLTCATSVANVSFTHLPSRSADVRCVFMGESGAGKSTLAAALRGRAAQVCPAQRRLPFRRAAKRSRSRRRALTIPRRNASGKETVVSKFQLVPRVRRSNCPSRIIVCLSFGDGISVQPIHGIAVGAL